LPGGNYLSFDRVPADPGEWVWPVELAVIPAIQTLVQDGFEDYAVGAYPTVGGWQELWSGAATSSVVDSTAASGGQSLAFFSSNPGWTRADGVQLDLTGVRR